MAFRALKQREPLTQEELFEYAVKSLGAKMRSVRDLRRLMAKRVEPGEEGERKMGAVVTKLEEMRYLSDLRFAADFTRMRQENQKFGRRRVQQDLMYKGIAKPLIEETLNSAYEEVDEATLAMQYIERKRIKPPSDQKESARVMRRLVGAGFSTGTVYKVLRQMRVPVEETALEGLDEVE